MKLKYKIKKEYLIKRYIKELKTIGEIAKEIKCNEWVIKDRMKKYHIKIRTHGQTKRLRGTFKKENNPAWKGEKPKCPICGKQVSTHSTKFCNEHTPTYKSKNGMWKGGKPKCINCGKEICYGSSRCSHCAKIGKLHHRWIGSTPLALTIRHLREYKQWRTQVFQRDNYTCQECGKINCYLEVHHKKEFHIILAEFIKEHYQFSPIEEKEVLIRLAIKYKSFWDLENGVTLCKNCHDLTKK